MKIYTGYMMYEKEEDWPDVGEIFVCLDVQNRLGPQTWLIGVQGDGTSQGDTVQICLFWEVYTAVKVAQFLNDDKDLLIKHIKRVNSKYGISDADDKMLKTIITHLEAA